MAARHSPAAIFFFAFAAFAGRRDLPIAPVPTAPVMAPAPMPVAPAPVTTSPAPVTMAPAPMAVMPSPPHLLRLQLRHFPGRGDGGLDCIGSRQASRIFDRLWQQRRSLRACGERGGASRNSEREFQKVPTLHDIVLSDQH